MAQGKTKAPQDLLSELGVEDLYSFLGVEFKATDKEITSAYRKKALKYHPDKNPDDPTAAERFQKLSKAYNVLTDPAAKAAYDQWLKAKQRAKIRHDELNAKRRKLKESLETKESQHVQNVEDEREAARRMQKEIERLREEGFRKVKEQEELLRQQLNRGNGEDEEEDQLPTLKVTWKAKKSDTSNGGYSEDILQRLLAKFGPVHHILVSARKKGKAVVSFNHATDAQAAVGCEEEFGIPGNPLVFCWLSGQPRAQTRTTLSREEVERVTDRTVPTSFSECTKLPPNISSNSSTSSSSLQRDNDYESITLMRLRQAEERKRLAQKLAQEDSQ